MEAQQSMGSVLVIGGCGYLGHQIVQRLLEINAATAISVLDIQTNRNRLNGINYYDGDICSKSVVQSIFAQIEPQVIFHTASPPATARDLELFLRVNVQGTRNLVQSAQEVKTVVAFVYTSSASVIDDAVNDLLDVDESAPVLYMPAQMDAYNHSKAVAESVVLKANRINGKMLTTALRPSGLFGEDDKVTVKPMVDAAAEGKYRYQVGNGKNLFDWTYIGNAVDAHILAAQALFRASESTTRAPVNESVDGEAFLLTNDEAVPFWDFARALGAAAGYPIDPKEIRVIPRLVGLIMATVAEWDQDIPYRQGKAAPKV
ncbi:MAG: hypothetical protein Q9179_000068 [Wetmoreana sp. 5 TL-2023]